MVDVIALYKDFLIGFYLVLFIDRIALPWFKKLLGGEANAND